MKVCSDSKDKMNKHCELRYNGEDQGKSHNADINGNYKNLQFLIFFIKYEITALTVHGFTSMTSDANSSAGAVCLK